MTLTLKKSATELKLARYYKYFKDIVLFLFTHNERFLSRLGKMSDSAGAVVSNGYKLPNVGAMN